jgi:hypothetical protein
MMRGIRRLVVYTAVSGLIAAGAVTASMEVAHADTVVQTCIGASDRTPKFECDMQANIQAPSAITVSATDNSGGKTNEDIAVSWTFTCSDANATSPQVKGGITGMTPLTEPLTPLPATAADGTCNVSAIVKFPTNPTTQDPFTARLSYTPSTSASPSPSPSPTTTSNPPHVVGFGSKCLDDRGNSSSNRAQVVIWTCSGSDPAENWQFSNNEFIHNGKCLNDQGNGGIRSKVILWTCNGASNEKWSELANGEIRLQSHGNTLCLDDPRSSTQNGTQLIVYTCTDSANQKWKHP